MSLAQVVITTDRRHAPRNIVISEHCTCDDTVNSPSTSNGAIPVVPSSDISVDKETAIEELGEMDDVDPCLWDLHAKFVGDSFTNYLSSVGPTPFLQNYMKELEGVLENLTRGQPRAWKKSYD